MNRNPIIFYINKQIMALVMILLILISLLTIYLLSQKYEIVKATIYSPDYEAKFTIVDKKLLDEFRQVLESKAIKTSPKKPNGKFIIKIERRIGSDEYVIANKNLIYDMEKKIFLKLNEPLKNKINRICSKLEELSPFGTLVSWEEIDSYFPRYSKATIRDLETGLSFKVQRRAGSKHSDVQPLTKEDTAIFKKIYNGKWSWRRRAAILEVDNHKIAASMNGMPHGAGAISGNNFSGHFCVHFLNSRVHTSNKVDPAHQAMVWKSAGKFQEYVANLSADDFPNLYFTLLDQNDEDLIKYILIKEDEQIKGLLEDLERAKLESAKPIVNKKKIKVFKGKAKLINLEQKEKVIDYTIELIPNNNYKGWLINSIRIY